MRPMTGTGSARKAAGDALRPPSSCSCRRPSTAMPALGSESTGSEPLPIWLAHATTRARAPCPRSAARDARQHALRLLLDVCGAAREPAQRRQLALQALGIRVELQDRFERGERHLVDAQRALHRILADARDELLAPDDEARLRAAEELVAAERDDVRAVRERFARRRLVRQAVVLEIDEHAAAEIDDERQARARARAARAPLRARSR